MAAVKRIVTANNISGQYNGQSDLINVDVLLRRVCLLSIFI